VRLACFLLLSVCVHLFLILADRKLTAVFERGMIPIQERYMERDLLKSGRSKKYSELELSRCHLCDSVCKFTDTRTVQQMIYEKEVRGFVSAVRIANRTARTETGLKSGMNQFSNYVGYIAAGLFAVSGRIGLATVARTVLLIPLIQNILSLVMVKYVHRRNVIVSKQRLMDLAGKGTGGEKEPDFWDIQIRHLDFSHLCLRYLLGQFSVCGKGQMEYERVTKNGAGVGLL